MGFVFKTPDILLYFEDTEDPKDSSSTNFANNNLFYFLIIFDHKMTHNCQPTKPNLQMF